MLLSVVAVIGGLALLVWGADRFVLGAAATARNFGVSPLVVGLTVVGVGTSAPEILVSGVAAWGGNPGLAIGNAFGSNIANIALVVGATAVVRPLVVRSAVLRREFPMMFAVMLLAGGLIYDLELGRFDGIVLMVVFVVVLAVMGIIASRPRPADPLERDFEVELPGKMPNSLAGLWIAVGLAVLLVGSRTVVWGAVNIAVALGVSDLIIGLTIVAVGTSLPELAASVASVLRGESDLAVGNVLGSNMFNLLPVLALPGLLAPGPVPHEALWRDFAIMMVLTLILLAMAWGRGEGRVNRWEGAALLLAFCGYEGLLYLAASGAP